MVGGHLITELNRSYLVLVSHGFPCTSSDSALWYPIFLDGHFERNIHMAVAIELANYYMAWARVPVCGSRELSQHWHEV